MFRQAQSAEDMLRVFMIRGIVFMEEQGISLAEELDEHDAEAVHILGEIEGEPVACGRIRLLDGEGRLQRLAVRRKWRGRGIGGRLLEFMLDRCRSMGVSEFSLHAQTRARDFYLRYGFEACGEEFMEAGIPHVLMRRSDTSLSDPCCSF